MSATRLVANILAVLAAGIALGVLSAWFTIAQSADTRISDGPWQTNVAAGSPESDAYRRAYAAMHGLFAPDRSEAVTYTASADDAGHALDGRCRYEISGRDPDTQWWSITAYGNDDFLIPNPAHRYSVSQVEIRRDAGGAFSVAVGGAAREADWIPVRPGPFTLTLRLYGPGASVLVDPAHAALPQLKKIGCP